MLYLKKIQSILLIFMHICISHLSILDQKSLTLSILVNNTGKETVDTVTETKGAASSIQKCWTVNLKK